MGGPVSRLHNFIALVLTLAMAAVYSAVTLLRFNHYVIASFDNAIFEQAIKSYARPGAPIVNIKGPDYNILGDHFSPVTALIAPIYKIFPSAQTILLAQVALISLSIFVITVMAMRYMGAWVGALVGLLYSVSFGIQSAVESNFHEVAFAAPLLALAGAAYLDQRWRDVMLWSLPLLLVKEDLGITVAAIGFVLWLVGERRRGVLLALAGVAGAVLVVFVIIPSFNPDGVYAYASQGDRGRFEVLFDQLDRKGATALLTVAITGLAALWSPWVLVTLPTLLGRFANDVPFYWGTEWHYSLVLMPVVFVAMVDAVQRKPQLKWAVPVGVVVSGFMMVNSPVVALADSTTWEEPARAEQARLVLSLVPDGASVETDIGLMTHLISDNDVYWLGTVGDATPEYVLFDLDSNIGSPADVVAYAEDAHGGTYELIYDNGGYVLAKRQ